MILLTHGRRPDPNGPIPRRIRLVGGGTTAFPCISTTDVSSSFDGRDFSFESICQLILMKLSGEW